MPGRRFNQPPKTVSQHIALLTQRGMAIPDQSEAEHYLRYIGYNRLSEYWFPFQAENSNGFKAGSCFNIVLEHYIFDRKLRLVMLDAVERIEIAARSIMMNTMCLSCGAHWHGNRQNFKENFDYDRFFSQILKDNGIDPENKHKQSRRVQDYLNTYSNPAYPPAWAIFENLSFGTISVIFRDLSPEHRKRIAHEFCIKHRTLQSWLHSISSLRNLCAHFSRLWNRVFSITPRIPENANVPDPKKLYAQAVISQIFLTRISQNSHWPDRLKALFDEYPGISKTDMGFPDNWESYPVWRGQ